MNDSSGNKNERDFLRVVKLGAAISLAGMAAFLYSLKQVHPSLRLEFTAGTVIVFILAAAFVWMVGGLLFKETTVGGAALTGHLRKPVVRWVIFFAVVSVLGTVGAFAYAVKDVSSGELRNVMQGVLMAGVTLAFVGLMFWRVVRYFEDTSKNDDPKPLEEEE